MTYDTDDIVDRVAELAPDSPTRALRHQRAKVVEATQGSYDALFDPALEGLTLVERLLVALYASRLAPSPALAVHYRAELAAHEVDAATLAAVETGTPEDLSAPRLRAILAFTRTLIENPVAGDKAALQTLPAAGLTTPAVVALAQLIAFLSYQTRLVAGLQALKQLERAS
ncbi:CMD domain protein [Paraburkholderia sp. CNPSo 3076]|nr:MULTISPECIES: CMD domain protein [unclassified Paraburkholderia]MCP3716742.1 CMD domain protein [Paraburkholderia sp. CNPSo 3281]MCX5539755.1 CMD domain protein [Paraburkholderia sp. CNPSo 3076]